MRHAYPLKPPSLPPISKSFPSFRLTVHRETEASDKNEEGTALLLQPMIPFLANRCPTFLNARQIWPLFCYLMRNALQMKGANLLRLKSCGLQLTMLIQMLDGERLFLLCIL